MAPRCNGYLTDDKNAPDIAYSEDLYDPSRWKDMPSKYGMYMDTGLFFYSKLLRFNGLMLHSSAVELDGKAYLFSGPSGIGKSTHTALMCKAFPQARIFNDDKPALRCLDGRWYAYGTPWCGKDGININLKAELAGICFLRRGAKNSIRRLSPIEAASAVISQTLRRFSNSEALGVMTELVNRLVETIPIYELIKLPNIEAAQLSYEAMSIGAREIFNEN